MCNINVILRKDGTPDEKLAQCMNVVTYLSFNRNDDGEGYFTNNFKVVTSPHKIIYKGRYKMIVSHQRLATSGKNEDMIQPLETEHFIIVHNGIFGNKGTDRKSDTFEYLKELEKIYLKTKDTKKAIEKLHEKISGSYSIVLYNKKTKELLYYKEKTTTMYFANGKHYLLMSTSKDNIEYMKKYLGVRADIKEPDEEKIYDIKQSLQEVGEFKDNGYWWNINKKNKFGVCGHLKNDTKGFWSQQDINKLREEEAKEEEDEFFDEKDYQKGSQINSFPELIDRVNQEIVNEGIKSTLIEEVEKKKYHQYFDNLSSSKKARIRNSVLDFMHKLFTTAGISYWKVGMQDSFITVRVSKLDNDIIEGFFPEWTWKSKKYKAKDKMFLYYIDFLALLQQLPNIDRIYLAGNNLYLDE